MVDELFSQGPEPIAPTYEEASPIEAAEESDNALDPLVIDALAPRLLEEDYAVAKDKLKQLYADNSWTDKEIAAQKIAEVSDLLDKANRVETESEMPKGAFELSQVLLDTTLDNDLKVKKIEEWRSNAKFSMYNSENPDDFINGVSKEAAIDQFATDLRRSIYGKDRSTVVDGLARGIEAALAPIAGVTDAILDTDLKKAVTEFLQDYQNPEKDGSIAASLFSGAGSVAGFAASTLGGPVSSLSYLGATLVDQAKSVYDTAYKETKSPEAAKSALLNSTPGILLGTFSDRLLGGSLGSILKGGKGFVGTVAGAAGGAVGSAAQVYNTGKALSYATGEEKFEPTLRQVLTEAAAGGALGGVVGAASDINKAVDREIGIRKLEAEIKSTVKNQDTTSSGITIKRTKSSVENRNNLFDEYTKTPETVKPGVIVEKDVVADGTPEDNIGAAILEESDERVISTPRELTITPAPEGFEPNPFMRSIAFELGAEMKVVPGIKDALAFYQTGTDKNGNVINRIVVDSRIFRDANQANSTVAHEIGHLVDYADSRLDIDENKPPAGTKEESEYLANEPVLNKLIRFKKEVNKQFNAAEIQKDAKELSARWRQASERDLSSEYRNNPKEIQADVFSALMNNPDLVAREFPRIWEAFNAGLETNPRLKNFWTEYVETATNPDKLRKWQQERREAGRLREAEIMQEAAEQNIEDSKIPLKEKIQKARQDITTRLINRFSVAKDVFLLQAPKTPQREAAAKLYNELYSGIKIHNSLAVLFDAPFNRLKADYEALEFPRTAKDPLSTWKDYEFHNRILNETTQSIEAIKTEPLLYRQVGEQIKASLAKHLKNQEQPESLNPFIDTDFSNLEGQALVDELAKFQNPKFKGYTDLILKDLKALDPELALAGQTLLDPSTFNVRRYTANPDTDVKTSERAMSLMKQQLGEEKFKKLQEVSERFHDIIGNNLFTTLKESGKISPELLNHLKLNKNNYVNFNVLKYFENDPVFVGNIKKQYGTFNQIGDELSATIMKSKALIYSSEYQKATNAALNLARMGGYEVTPVSTERRKVKGKFEWVQIKDNVFDLANRLQAEDPESSYMIQFADGVPTLYKVNSPEFSKMFSEDSWAANPTIAYGLDFLDAHAKLFAERELKTILSAPFVFSQPIFDRVKEAMYGRSFIPTFLGRHLSPELRQVEKTAEAETLQFLKGESTPLSEELIKSGVLQHGYATDYGVLNDASVRAEHAVYEAMGVKIPGEDEARLPTRINNKINKILDDWSFGFTKFLKKKAVKDEAKTKIIGYLLAKKKGLSDAEAAIEANEYFGTPDPLGGGTNATSINKLALFGRAHINGLRAVVNQLKGDPRGFGMQYGVRKAIPRLMLSSSIMAPLVGALFGEEEETKTRKFLDKIPTFEKIGKSIIPLGFRDGDGKFVGFNVRADQIDDSYKAEYMRLPSAREFVTIANLQEPSIKALEELIDTGEINVKHFLNNLASGLGAAFGSQPSPAIQGSVHMAQLLGGYNPTDFYRSKGILPKDVQEAGTMVDKFYNYMLWSLTATAPGIFNLGPGSKQTSTENLDIWDDIASIPVAGPTLKRFFGSTNYGDLEQSELDKQRKTERDAEIRIHMGDVSKEIYNEFTKTQALVSRLGKGWREELSDSTANKITLLQNWNTRVYRHAFNELRAAYENGDEEAIQEISKNLEMASQAMKDDLKRNVETP